MRPVASSREAPSLTTRSRLATVWLPVALLVLAVASASGQQGGTSGAAGRIEGTAVLGPNLSIRKMRFRLYSDFGPQVSRSRDIFDANELQNVVIYVDSISDHTAAPYRIGDLAVRQADQRFAPHVLAVVKGSTVGFPNDDPIFHNVFSLSKTQAFDLGRYPRGESKSVRFDRAGIVQAFCHIHADMSAIILVLDNPYFTKPDRLGRYSLDGLPPGTYRLVAWHERIQPVVREVAVQASRTTRIDFSIPLPDGLEAP